MKDHPSQSVAMVNDIWQEQKIKKDLKIMDQMAYQDELLKSSKMGHKSDDLYANMMSSPIERKEKMAKYE